MKYLEKWLIDVASRPSMKVSMPIHVEGISDKILGPRSDYAKIEVACEPAESLEVIIESPNLEEAKHEGYIDSATFGLLDVFLTELPYPLREVRLTISGIVIHPIHSNQMAFRHAGRDAGRKIIESLKRK